MYTQIFFVTSVRGAVFTPQTFANASLSFFGAKMPTAFFFALSDAFVAFVMVGFFVAVVVTVVFFAVVVVIADEQQRGQHEHEEERIVCCSLSATGARR